MDFWNWLAFVVVAGALVLASPLIVEQACSDEEEYVHPEDAWCSGATPDCPSHYEAWNTLPTSY